jgi:FkbM family methyltransferase
MRILPGPLKQFLRRFKVLSDFNTRLHWQIHLFKDWWGTKVWKKTNEVVTPLGFKLISGFHPAYQMMRSGTFEPEETALIQRFLDKVDIFVDIGANLGYYTCLALHNGKSVIAFEPQKQNLQCLYQNLIANGWQDGVEIYPVALSAKPGLLTLYGASGPSASLIRNWAGYSPRFHQIVPASTLDSVLTGRPANQRLFIKIDVEGAEYQVLSGAHTTLARELKPIWLLEICLHEFHPGGMNPDYPKIFQLFWDNGYQAFTAAQKPTLVARSDVDRWVNNKFCDSGTFNYLFVDQEDAGKWLGK